jgi:hypothetical protein
MGANYIKLGYADLQISCSSHFLSEEYEIEETKLKSNATIQCWVRVEVIVSRYSYEDYATKV